MISNRKKYRKLANLVLVILVWIVTCGSLLAQPGSPSFSLTTNTFVELDMQSIALLDIESNSATPNFTFTVPTITEAGQSVGSAPLATNNDNWLNFSCAVRDVTSRSIQVSVSTGTVPGGFEIRLSVGAASGFGGGTLGTPTASPITLSALPQDIVTGIRGSFTGDGANNGYRLNYSLYSTGADFDQVEAQNGQVTILYTIIDN